MPSINGAGNALTPLWQYPAANAGYLAPIQASPVVAAGTSPGHASDTVYVCTMDGRILALTGNGVLAWETDVSNPISAAPVLEKDPADGQTYLLAADAGGGIHLINGGSGAVHAGWPTAYLNELFTTSPAVSAEHQAYLIGEKSGNVYKIDLTQQNKITAPTWQSNNPYSVGMAVQPVTPNGYYYICTACTAPGTSGNTPPTWPTTVGTPVTDGFVTWNTVASYPPALTTQNGLWYQPSPVFDASANVLALSATLTPTFGTDTTQQVLFGFAGSVPAWQPLIAYTVGTVVQPTTSNGFYYTCTVAGTSGAAPPTWPITLGGQVTDGTVIWTAINGASIAYITLSDAASPAQLKAHDRRRDGHAIGVYAAGRHVVGKRRPGGARRAAIDHDQWRDDHHRIFSPAGCAGNFTGGFTSLGSDSVARHWPISILSWRKAGTAFTVTPSNVTLFTENTPAVPAVPAIPAILTRRSR